MTFNFEVQLDNTIDKTIASYLFRDVVANTIDVAHLAIGDTVVVTLDATDKIGIVSKLMSDKSFILKTASGLEIIEPASQGYMHMIHKADNEEGAIEHLKLRDHLSYERDLKDMTKDTHQHKGRPEHSPEIDTKTGIPRSKICLNLKRTAADDSVPASPLSQEDSTALQNIVAGIEEAQYGLTGLNLPEAHGLFGELLKIKTKVRALMNATSEVPTADMSIDQEAPVTDETSL